MNLIKFTRDIPPGFEVIAEGTFQAKMQPVLAELLLKIPNGEYVVRELQQTLIRALREDPSIIRTHNLDGQLFYSFVRVQDGADFGSSIAHFTILARRR